MPPKKKQGKAVQQVIILGLVLIVLQVGYIYFVPHTGEVTAQSAIDDALKKQKLPKERQEQMRIQLSVNHFKDKNGRLPTSLQELVPVYFQSIPKDSAGKPFQYAVKNGRPYVSSSAAVEAAAGPTDALSAASGVVPASLEQLSSLSPEIQKALMDSLNPDHVPLAPPFVYDPTGKRDPFRPFDFSPKVDEDDSKTPLEKYDINQLKVTAILNNAGVEPSAMVENAAGRGFTVKKGTKIGIKGGEVVEIQPDRLVIIEVSTDFTGKQKSRTIELRLRTKDQEERLIGGR
jgi:type IV pilus assembly protein PilP